jgi:hypothetical protein
VVCLGIDVVDADGIYLEIQVSWPTSSRSQNSHQGGVLSYTQLL